MMNQRPLLGLIALLIAITSAVLLVMLGIGLPAEAIAATPSARASGGAEPGPLSLLVSAVGVVLWLVLRRER